MRTFKFWMRLLVVLGTIGFVFGLALFACQMAGCGDSRAWALYVGPVTIGMLIATIVMTFTLVAGIIIETFRRSRVS